LSTSKSSSLSTSILQASAAKTAAAEVEEAVRAPHDWPTIAGISADLIMMAN
jgi:hypothetical protein